MENCIFCKIINKQIPSYTVYEDDICIAFLDIAQGTIGHTLVVSKEHYSNLLEIPSDVLKHIVCVAQNIAKSLSKMDGVKGINLLNNCNEVAGQSVMHFHMHVIPRYEVSDAKFEPTSSHNLTSEEFVKLQENIKKGLE